MVEHINRNGKLKFVFLFVRKLVDELLGFDRPERVIDQFTEMPPQVRKKEVEPLHNVFGMGVIFGKNDGFAQAVAPFDFLASLHEVEQYLVDGVLIEKPGIQFVGVEAFWDVAVLVAEGFLVFFFLRKVVVADALPGKFQRDRHAFVRPQVAISHGLTQRVVVGWFVLGQIEKGERIAVGFVFGRGRQSHQQGVEIFKNGAVFFVNAAVCFVDDDQVDIAYSQRPLVTAPESVDAVQNGLVR